MYRKSRAMGFLHDPLFEFIHLGYTQSTLIPQTPSPSYSKVIAFLLQIFAFNSSIFITTSTPSLESINLNPNRASLCTYLVNSFFPPSTWEILLIKQSTQNINNNINLTWVIEITHIIIFG